MLRLTSASPAHGASALSLPALSAVCGRPPAFAWPSPETQHRAQAGQNIRTVLKHIKTYTLSETQHTAQAGQNLHIVLKHIKTYTLSETQHRAQAGQN